MTTDRCTGCGLVFEQAQDRCSEYSSGEHYFREEDENGCPITASVDKSMRESDRYAEMRKAALGVIDRRHSVKQAFDQIESIAERVVGDPKGKTTLKSDGQIPILVDADRKAAKAEFELSSEESRKKRFENAKDWVFKEYASTFEKLAEVERLEKLLQVERETSVCLRAEVARVASFSTDYSFALAQLRHLYTLMLNGYVKDCAEAARGLLGPSIEKLEKECFRAKDADQ